MIKRFFFDNWLKKLLSLTLAVLIWYVLDRSFTETKTLNTVGVRIINLPPGKTVLGLQPSGYLNKRFTVTVEGRRSLLNNLSANDVELVIDGNEFSHNRHVVIKRHHLVSTNPELSILSHINSVTAADIPIQIVPFVTEKIPVNVARVGEPPKGFQCTDIFPYRFFIHVSGPEETVNKLKAKGLSLSINLNQVNKSDLERIYSIRSDGLISFYVPDEWKVLSVPSISEMPLKIDDPDINLLRIDFIRTDALPIGLPLPVSLFIQQSTLAISSTDLIGLSRGIKVLNKHLFVSGVDERFLSIVKEHIAISIHTINDQQIEWCIQFMNPSMLENRYVAAVISDYFDESLRNMSPSAREEYLRNRFRNYMNRMTLLTDEGKPLQLSIQLKGKEVIVKECIDSSSPPNS